MVIIMKNVKYEIEEGILVIEDREDSYLDIDIDDIESVYSEFTANGYALLILKVGRDLQIELQTKDDNVIPIKEKLWKMEGHCLRANRSRLHFPTCSSMVSKWII